MKMKQPNLFIVGAARSGTTTLWHCLKENSHVFMPQEILSKEPAFFSRLRGTRFNKWEDYLKLFAAANENHRWVGEASTAYLTDPDCAKRIHDYNPDARIIIVLRNPVHRAYSLYNWMVQEGYEYAANFERALELEDSRKNKTIPNYYEPEYYYNFLYFNSGLYHKQVRRYMELFGDQVFFLVFEDFIDDITTGYAAVCRFLQVEPGPCRHYTENPSSAVKSPVEQFLLRKITSFLLRRFESSSTVKSGKDELEKLVIEELSRNLEALNKVTKTGIIRRVKLAVRLKRLIGMLHDGRLELNLKFKENRDILMTYGRKTYPPRKINRKTANLLKEKYRDDIAGLSAYTGTDFSHWLK
jgi:hypothetical protein